MIVHNVNIERVWRKELIASTSGRVLEVGAGEGENFKFYPPMVRVIATDPSERILRKAREQAALYKVSARFIARPVEALKFESQSFDAIVSTLSLCAYENPGAVLWLFNHWCKLDGKVLLLEHGLSSWQFVRWLQRKLATVHHRYAGCHLDLDIAMLLSHSPLQIVEMKKKLLGTTSMIWAAPSEVLKPLPDFRSHHR